MPPPVVEPLPPPPEPVRKRDPVSDALLLAGLGLVSFGVFSFFGLILGVRTLVRAVRRPGAHRKAPAVVAIVANLVSLSIAVDVVRSLLRAHVSTAEATAIEDIRIVISAQGAHAELNDGRYQPRLECLVEPSVCQPDYPPDGPRFLDEARASLRPRAGYRRAFHPGPPAAPRPPSGGHPRPRGVVSFAYTAVPEEPGQTGVRGFCGDSTALICFTPDGREPGVTPDGRCDLSTCTELR